MEADDFMSDGFTLLKENLDEDMKKTGNKLSKCGKEVCIVPVVSFYPFFLFIRIMNVL
jgi:hypothetical protein